MFTADEVGLAMLSSNFYEVIWIPQLNETPSINMKFFWSILVSQYTPFNLSQPNGNSYNFCSYAIGMNQPHTLPRRDERTEEQEFH